MHYPIRCAKNHAGISYDFAAPLKLIHISEVNSEKIPINKTYIIKDRLWEMNLNI